MHVARPQHIEESWLPDACDGVLLLMTAKDTFLFIPMFITAVYSIQGSKVVWLHGL
jgi:hypothetical protein